MTVAPSEDQHSDKDGTRLLKSGYMIALSVIIFSGAITGTFIWNFYGSILADDSAKWGQLGDYVGGTINPLIGLATVILILINIKIQRLELRASLAQLQLSNRHTARQSFEQSLFAWLGNYRDLIASIRLSDGSNGRAVLIEWYYKNFSALAVDQRCTMDNIGQPIYENPIELSERLQALRKGVKNGDIQPIELHTIFRKAMHGFKTVYQGNRSDLDALFRTLYRLIHWIDNTETDIAQRRHYVSLIRAQLSWVEMVYLLFNGLTPEGKKFALLCNKYALFDNMTSGSDEVLKIICEDLPLFPPPGVDPELVSPWPYTSSAFSSDIARAEEVKMASFKPPMFARGAPK